MGCSPSKTDDHTGFEYSALGYQGMLIHNNKNGFRTTDERKVATENVDNEEKENKNNKTNADDKSVKSGELIIPPTREPTQLIRPESAPHTKKPSETQCKTLSARNENSTNDQVHVKHRQSDSPVNENIERKENEDNDNKSLKSESLIISPRGETNLERPNSEPPTNKAEQNGTSSAREEISSAHGRRPVSRYVRSAAKELESEPVEDTMIARRESASSVTRNETNVASTKSSGEERVASMEVTENSTESTESQDKSNSTCLQNNSKIIPPVPEIIMSEKSPVSISKEEPLPSITPTAMPESSSTQSQNGEKEPVRESRSSSNSSIKEPQDTPKPLPRRESAHTSKEENGLQREWTTYRNDSFCSSASSVRRGSTLTNHGDGKTKITAKPPSRESSLSCHSSKLTVPPSRESAKSGNEYSDRQSSRSSRRESKADEKETMEESWILSGRQSATLKREISDTGSVSSQSEQGQENDKDKTGSISPEKGNISPEEGNKSPEKQEHLSSSRIESRTDGEAMNGTEEPKNPRLGSTSSQTNEKEPCPQSSETSSRKGSISSVQNDTTEQDACTKLPNTESLPEREVNYPKDEPDGSISNTKSGDDVASLPKETGTPETETTIA